MKRRLHVVLTLAVALAAAASVAAGCGGSDEPAYCSNVSDLKQSVDDLKSVQPDSSVVSTLQADLQKVQSNANAVVNSAKQDFPNQTSALQSSVSTLSATINKLPPSPTPQQLVSLVPQVNSVGSCAGLLWRHSSACDEPELSRSQPRRSAEVAAGETSTGRVSGSQALVLVLAPPRRFRV